MKDRLYALVLALCLIVVLDAAVNMSPFGARSVSGRGVVPPAPLPEVSGAALEYGPDAFVWGDGESPFADPDNDPVTNIYWEMQGGAYSYGGGCHDDGVDPVGMILLAEPPTGQQTETTADEAFDLTVDALEDADLVSGDEDLLNDRQHYNDYGVCVLGEITQATPGLSRWHTRCNFLSGQLVSGMEQTYWSSCTPHWDWYIWDPIDAPGCGPIGSGLLGGHAVPPVHSYEEFNGPNVSGFTTAREWLHDRLEEDGAVLIVTEEYGNTRPQDQCNGDQTAGSGTVYVRLVD